MELKKIFSFKRKTQLLFEYYQEYFFYKLSLKRRKFLRKKINNIWKKVLNKSQVERLDKELCVIKIKLNEDAIFAYKNDPSYKDLEEVIQSSLGLYSMMVYRISHFLADINTYLIPRLLSEYAHSKTGIDIHPEATIGTRCFIDHGTGVVIGQTAYIGNEVRIYQGVTIGAKSIKVNGDYKNKKRHPTILDNVTIYANATILGGETVIGSNSIIGANKMVLESIGDNSKVI